MKVAIVQFAVNDEESKEQKIIRMEGILDNLKGTDLIVLPELWNIGFFAYEEYAKQSELLTVPPSAVWQGRQKNWDPISLQEAFLNRMGISVIIQPADRPGGKTAGYIPEDASFRSRTPVYGTR